MSQERVPGMLLTEPKIRAYVACAPTGPKALRVRVFTREGLEILSMRAVEVETQVVEIPRPLGSTPPLEKCPGSIWFYGANGEGIGFMPDHVVLTLARPGAVERPVKGPTTPRTVAGLQDALRAVLGGLENLAAYLESRARRLGHREVAEDAAGDVRALVRWAADTSERDADRRARFAAAMEDSLGNVLRAARSSALADDNSRAAALRFEPVAELARRVLERELDRLRSATV